MTNKIVGVVCPKQWKRIGKNGKPFTIVVNNENLKLDQNYELDGETFSIYKAGDVVDNGRKYKAIGEETNTKGFSIESLIGLELNPGNDVKEPFIKEKSDFATFAELAKFTEKQESSLPKKVKKEIKLTFWQKLKKFFS